MANPVEGCLEALKAAIRYAAGNKYECLETQPDSDIGFNLWTDSDWVGTWGMDGETQSRSGGLVTYNEMPVDWWSSKQ